MASSSTRRPQQLRDRSLTRDARDLQRAVGDLVRIYQFRDRKSICYYNVSVTQCYALSAIVARGSLTQNELAAELYLDKSTASRVVGELVRKGYVHRAADRKDGRVRNLEATVRGHGLHQRIERDLVEETQKLIAGHDHDARRTTIELVARLADAAAARFGFPESSNSADE
jgi:MarR family 2-MHQ and catechol resistance regulon transcriptional repressor